MSEHSQHAPNIDRWLALIQADGVGPTLFHRILDHFGGVDQALGAKADEFARIEGIGPAKASRILSSLGQRDPQRELDAAQKQGVHLIHMADPRYPTPLKRIYDPPPILYVKGELTRRHPLCVAIVGSRDCSLYGQEQAARFAHLLANADFTIVSGMARGIDAAAHRGALSAGGQTLAVQGSGLARCYPPEHKKLFEEICSQGACISELPMDAAPKGEHFPTRNRIIAGMSLATMIVEAGLRSGAMITARLALENNREVLAVPGRIDSPLSRGPHQLLKQGAVLVESIEDIVSSLGAIGAEMQDHVQTSMEELSQKEGTKKQPVIDHLTKTEQLIYCCLGQEPQHADHITGHTRLPVGKVTADLVSLQLKGLVKSLPGNLFKLTGH